MNSAGPFLPADAHPPHDPMAMRLSARAGWRLADALVDGIVAIGESLQLAIVTPATPQLLDPLGSFGGIRPPVFVAYTPDGGLYLLDRASGRVLWFDACSCGFTALPCPGWPDALRQPRQPHQPREPGRTLAITANDTLLAIAGISATGGWVVVLGRHDLAPRHVLQRDWEPMALALDQHGGLYVADRKHGAVLRFRADGSLAWTRLPGVLYGLAVDRTGTLYMATLAGAFKYEPGRADALAFTSEDMRAQFAPLPLRLDGKGRLLLGELCQPRRAGALFGTDGSALSEAAIPLAAAVYRDTGRVVIGPLDSRIHACQWHRLAFDVDLPAGTRLTIRSRSDEIVWTIAEMADVTDPAWSAPQLWYAASTTEYLIVSPPGRYLWLEITLAGDGSASPALTALELEFPRISLARYLPAVFGEQPVAADFTDRLLAIFDQGFRSVEAQLDALGYLFDARSTPAPMLDWLASWIGLAFPQGLPLARRRRLLRRMPTLYAQRGTAEGVRQLLLLYLGMDLPDGAPRLILEHWRLRRWLFLDRGRLGETSRLWGESVLNRSRVGAGMQAGVSQIKLERDPLRDPFHAHAHAFSVFLPAARGTTPAARRRIEALLAREAPAHTAAQVHWVRPNMRLGIQCALGFDTVLGIPCTPAPELGSMRLNGDAPLVDTGRPGRHLGINTRLGYP